MENIVHYANFWVNLKILKIQNLPKKFLAL